MFVLALCALGVLVALIALKETNTSVPLVHAEGTAAVITAKFTTTASSAPTTQAPATQPVDTGTTVEGATTSPSGAPAGAELVLTASRGDTWIAVRSGSAHGKLLFQGTLSKGSTQTFTGPVLWARFGNATNVDARLNGQSLSLPSGTVSIVITPQGLG